MKHCLKIVLPIVAAALALGTPVAVPVIPTPDIVITPSSLAGVDALVFSDVGLPVMTHQTVTILGVGAALKDVNDGGAFSVLDAIPVSAATPEPGPLFLIASGLVCLGLTIKRYRPR